MINAASLISAIARCFTSAALNRQSSRQTLAHQLPILNNEFMLFAEASMTLLYNYRRATCEMDLLVAATTFWTCTTGKSATQVTLDLFSTLSSEVKDFLPFWQSDASWIDVCDGLYQNVARVRGTVLGKKIIRVFNHLIAHAFYAKVGIAIDHELFNKLESKKIQPTVWNCVTFADAIVNLVLFLAKAGRQAMLTGSIEGFFVNDQSVADWICKAQRLRKDSEFINNPTLIDKCLPLFIKEFEDAIEQGKHLEKAFKADREVLKIVNSVVLELEMVLKRHFAALKVSSFRWCPFAFTLYGGSGVAKSFLTKGLFHHYCSIRDVDKESAVLWTRTEEEWFAGYKSHYMGVVIDDAVKHIASKVQGIDVSIKDIVSMCNNVSFVTPQAEAQDKGKIPFLAEWICVTTNVADLNADLYFNCSDAFLRRVPIRIEPVVKDEYTRTEILEDGSTLKTEKIDPETLPEGVQYPDRWVFKVSKAQSSGNKGMYVHYKTFENYADLLVFMGQEYERHIRVQKKLMSTVSMIGPEELCVCKVPISICICGRVSDILVDPTVVAQTDVDRVSNVVRLGANFKHLRGAERLYAQSILAGKQPGVPSEIKAVEEALEAFRQLTPTQKIALLRGFTQPQDDDEYLSFTPVLGQQCFFMQAQLNTLRENVISFAGTSVSDAELVLIEEFVSLKAPRYVADGWHPSDILRACFEYIAFYGGTLEDPARLLTREFLLSDRQQQSFVRCCVSKVGQWYLRYEWFNALCNTIQVGKRLSDALRDSLPEVLTGKARAYDTQLMGDHPFLQMVVGLCALVGFGITVMKLMGRFTPPQRQMDLNSVGHKPVVRESEKANVWVVPERTITRLDVDPRKVSNLEQLMAALRTSLYYAEITWDEGEQAMLGKTRVLLVANNTLLANSHAIKPRCRVCVWIGGRTNEGIQPSVTIDVEPGMLTRDVKRDIVFIRTRALPNLAKNLRHLFPKRSFQCSGPTTYLRKTLSGQVEELPTHGAHKRFLASMRGGGASTEAWVSSPEQPTVDGDCGSLLVMQSPIGTVILGMHCAYSSEENAAWSVPLYWEDFEHFEDMVEGGKLVCLEPLAQTLQFKVVPDQRSLLAKDKLFTDYHHDGRMMVHGQIQGFRARQVATGGYTTIAPHVLSRAHEFEPVIADKLGRPVIKAWQTPQNTLKNYLHPTHSMKESTLDACIEAFCEHIEANLCDEDWQDVHPVPLDVAVNGFPGVANIDALKFSTSAGHGHRGPKLQFLSEPEEFEEWQSFRRFTDAVVEDIDAIHVRAREGVRSHPIYTANFKNEMLKWTKIEADIARVFYMCPQDFLVAMRMSSMGLCRVIIRNRRTFRLAIGLNTHSEEWNDLDVEASQIAGDNWVAGDFKAFESILSILLSNGASEILIWMAKRSGNYDEHELLALRTKLADTVTPTIDFFGTLITLLGGEASGQQLTTIFNCLCNCLLHCYAWVEVSEEQGLAGSKKDHAAQWFKKVFCNTLGDDVYLKVCPSAPWYNHTSIQRVFGAMGIAYTMADKMAASRPYIPRDEVSFLKRSFREHESFPGTLVATLERDSIYKMLLYTVPSKAVSAEEQLASAFCSARAEAFFHGREFFEKVCELIDSCPKNEDLRHHMARLPTVSWRAMEKRFLAASPKLRAQLNVPWVDDPETSMEGGSHCPFNEPTAQASGSMDHPRQATSGRRSQERIYAGERLPSKKLSSKEELERALFVKCTTLSKNTRHTTENYFHPDKEMTLSESMKVINRISNAARRRFKAKPYGKTDSTMDRDDRDPRQYGSQGGPREPQWQPLPPTKEEPKWRLQADVSFDALDRDNNEQEGTDHVQGTTVFKNEPQGPLVDLKQARSNLTEIQTIPQDLATYLSRPRLVYTYSWLENGADGFKAEFFPWASFFTSLAQSNKLQGYSLLAADLHLKFNINGSPFYYGAMMANYTPFGIVRSDSAVGATISTRLVAESQKPHVWLNNQDVAEVQMVLPFLYPYPFVDISDASRLPQMGILRLLQFAPLLSANGSSSSTIDIQIYAWAENVRLGGPTERPVAQSKGERATISQKLAGLTSSLVGRVMPERLDGALGGVADALGFTNTPVTSAVLPFKQQPFTVASADLSEPVTKLSLSTKQGTAVGSTTMGGRAEDELHIGNFCARTSFLVGSDWGTTLNPGTILFTSMVTPVLFNNNASQIAHAPVSYASQHFEYWRGGITFTVKVIRSPYHRGRLQLSWDRAGTSLTQGASLGGTNAFNMVMDLDETSEASFTVPYSQAKHFLRTYQVNNLGTPTWSTDVSPPAGIWEEANGVFNVRVVNRLTAPEASSSARILVFVSGAKDIQFAGPRQAFEQTNLQILGLSSQTTSVAQSWPQCMPKAQSDITKDVCATTDLAPDAEAAGLYEEVFGERVISFREYLHRSSIAMYGNTTTVSPSLGIARYVWPIKRLPIPAGVFNNGWNVATTGAGAGQRVNFSFAHPLITLGSCFIGYKGSVNVSVNINRGGAFTGLGDATTVTRVTNGYTLPDVLRRPYSGVATSDGTSNYAMTFWPSGRGGRALTNPNTNTGISANLPYYSLSSFQLFDMFKEYNNQDNFTGANDDWWDVEYHVPKGNGSTTTNGLAAEFYYGSGQDFDLVFFINVPILNMVGVTPVA